MKKNITYLNLLTLIFLLPAQDLPAQIINKSAIAAVTFIEGKVWIKSNQQEKQQIKLGQQIFSDDVIFTRKSGYAEITFLNGNRIIKLQSNSELVFQAKQEQQYPLLEQSYMSGLYNPFYKDKELILNGLSGRGL